jgi:hypothetical protein
MIKPITPQKWLRWLHEEVHNETILAATKASIGGFTVMEAFAAISLLRVTNRGFQVAPLVTISQDAGRVVQTAVMIELAKKGFCEKAPDVAALHCTAWVLTKKGRAEVTEAISNLNALISKAKVQECLKNPRLKP